MFQKSLSETLGCGSLEFSPFVVFEKTDSVGTYEHIPCKNGYIVSCDTADYKDVFYITECAGGYTVKRVFKNTSGKIMHLRELGVRLNGI